MSKTWRLHLRRRGERLQVALRADDDSTTLVVDALPVDWRRLDEATDELMRVLDRGWQRGEARRQDADELRAAGERLTEIALPQAVRRYLLATDDGHMAIEADRHLQRPPWELAVLDGKPLGYRVAVGRVFFSGDSQFDSGIMSRTAASRAAEAPRIVVWANPQFNLVSADEEPRRIASVVRGKIANAKIAITRRNLTRAELLDELAGCDWFHFAGHAVDEQGQRGWQAADGHLQPRDVLGASQTWPRFILAHACASARPPVDADQLGLPEALLRMGVEHYLGTFAPFPDRESIVFAELFYQSLIAGQTVGIALRDARRHLAQRFGAHHLLWANYVLYGEPDEALVRVDESKPGVEAAGDSQDGSGEKTRVATRLSSTDQQIVRPESAPPEPRMLRYPVTCSQCGRELKTRHLVGHVVGTVAEPDVTCRHCLQPEIASQPCSGMVARTTSTPPEPTATFHSAVSPAIVPRSTAAISKSAEPPLSDTARRRNQHFWARFQQAVDRFCSYTDPVSGSRWNARLEPQPSIPFQVAPLGTRARNIVPVESRSYHFAEPRNASLPVLVVEVVSPRDSIDRALDQQDIDDQLARRVTSIQLAVATNHDEVLVFASISGWNDSAIRYATGAGSDVFYEPRRSLVLVDLVNDKFHYRAEDVRIWPFHSLWDLSDENDRVARVVRYVTDRLPLETSVAAADVAEELGVSTANVLTGFRRVAQLHHLQLDEIDGIGWVISQETA